jgi:hypothetical protein
MRAESPRAVSGASRRLLRRLKRYDLPREKKEKGKKPTSCNRRQHQDQQHIPTQPMPLIQPFRRLLPSIHLRHKISSESHQCLNRQENISDQTQDAMRRFEMVGPASELVDFDDDQSSDQEVKSEIVEHEVRNCAAAFLGRGVGGLED